MGLRHCSRAKLRQFSIHLCGANGLDDPFFEGLSDSFPIFDSIANLRKYKNEDDQYIGLLQ
jgi:hypothetical protein